MKKKKEPPAWDFLWYALYAFAGLGLEILLLSAVEPLLFGGVRPAAYSSAQKSIHWLLTSACWGILAWVLVYASKRKLPFDVLCKKAPEKRGIWLGLGCVLLCIVLNAFDWGTLKIIGEFQKKEPLLFALQYGYYFVEVVLVFLIVVFGQYFAEALLRKESPIPWGGLVLACTWGAVHFLSKGNSSDGLGTMAFSILFGMVYLCLNRNTKWSYLAMAAAFMI